MILLGTAFFLLASAISANKVILYALSPEFLVGLRMTGGAFLLALSLLIHSKKLISFSTLKKYFAGIIVIALFTTFFPSNFKAYALANMPSAKMAFFGTLEPFVAALYSFFWFHERLRWRQWLGICLGFIGMLVLVAGSSPLEEQMKAFLIFSYPELAALFAILLSRLGWIEAQQLLKREHFTPMQFTIMTMTIGGLLSLMTAFLRGTTGISSLAGVDIPLLQQVPFAYICPSGQLGILLAYTIVVGNMLGYTLYAHALKRHTATFVALAGFMIPLLVQLIGWIFLGESVSLLFFVACAITFFGVALFFIDEKKYLKVSTK